MRSIFKVAPFVLAAGFVLSLAPLAHADGPSPALRVPQAGAVTVSRSPGLIKTGTGTGIVRYVEKTLFGPKVMQQTVKIVAGKPGATPVGPARRTVGLDAQMTQRGNAFVDDGAKGIVAVLNKSGNTTRVLDEPDPAIAVSTRRYGVCSLFVAHRA